MTKDLFDKPDEVQAEIDELDAALSGKPVQKTLPDIIYDRSKLAMIEACPHQANLQESNPKDTDDVLPVSGTLIHELVEETYEYCKDSHESSDFADYFANELPKVRPDLQPEVIDGARTLIRYLMYINPSSVIAVEKQLDHVLIPATKTRGRIVITQCLDMIKTGFGDTIEVLDWKTGWKERTKAEAWQDSQAQCAAWLIWKNYGGISKDAEGNVLPRYDDVKFIFVETRKGKTAEAEFLRDKYHYGLPDLTQEMQFEARIAQAVRLHQEGCDEAWPNEKKCLWCNHVKECKLANAEAKELASDPYGYVRQYQVLDTLVGKMRKSIVDYLKAGNEIVDDSPNGLTARKKTPQDRFTLEVVDTLKPAKTKTTTSKRNVVEHDISQFK